jgi:hypothetical protein
MSKNKQPVKIQYIPPIDKSSIGKDKYARIARYTSEIINKDFQINSFNSEEELIDYIQKILSS